MYNEIDALREQIAELTEKKRQLTKAAKAERLGKQAQVLERVANSNISVKNWGSLEFPKYGGEYGNLMTFISVNRYVNHDLRDKQEDKQRQLFRAIRELMEIKQQAIADIFASGESMEEILRRGYLSVNLKALEKANPPEPIY